MRKRKKFAEEKTEILSSRQKGSALLDFFCFRDRMRIWFEPECSGDHRPKGDNPLIVQVIDLSSQLELFRSFHSMLINRIH